VVGVSQRATADTQIDTDRGVRNRLQYADTLHRQDPDGDELRPACRKTYTRSDAEHRERPVRSNEVTHLKPGSVAVTARLLLRLE